MLNVPIKVMKDKEQLYNTKKCRKSVTKTFRSREQDYNKYESRLTIIVHEWKNR